LEGFRVLRVFRFCFLCCVFLGGILGVKDILGCTALKTVRCLATKPSGNERSWSTNRTLRCVKLFN
jgi:hypothetical protein